MSSNKEQAITILEAFNEDWHTYGAMKNEITIAIDLLKADEEPTICDFCPRLYFATEPDGTKVCKEHLTPVQDTTQEELKKAIKRADLIPIRQPDRVSSPPVQSVDKIQLQVLDINGNLSGNYVELTSETVRVLLESKVNQ